MTHLFNSGRQRAELSHFLPAVFLRSPARVQRSKTVWVFALRVKYTYFIVTVPYYITVLFVVSADKFRYTCMSGEVTIEGVDDRKDMEETRRTFSLLGKNPPQLSDCNSLLNFYVIFTFFSHASPGLKENFQSDVFKVLAAILHLGNVEIRDSGGDKSSVPVSLNSRLFGRLDLNSLTRSSTERVCVSSSSVTHTWKPSVSCWVWAQRGWCAGCAIGGSFLWLRRWWSRSPRRGQ